MPAPVLISIGPAAAEFLPPSASPLSFVSFGDFVTSSQAWPFSLALLLFFAFSLVEIILVFTGIGADFGLEVDVDLPPGVEDAAGSWQVLDWLGLGRVPYLISLAAFLFCFGLLGLFVQNAQLQLIGHALPWPLAAIGCIVVALPAVRWLNFSLGRIWPKDETSAVSANSFVGREAIIVLGAMTADAPAQVKLRDEHGATHHLMAVADTTEDTFAAGDHLLIVGRRGALYTAIRHPNPTSTPASS